MFEGIFNEGIVWGIDAWKDFLLLIGAGTLGNGKRTNN
jgi:hypothetical protein